MSRASGEWARRAGLVAVAAGVAVSLMTYSGLASAAPSPSLSPLPSPSPSPSGPDAVTFAGTPAVGALFAKSRGRRRHFCTAAVLNSPAGDLGITAAHCLWGKRVGRSGDVTFAPAYHAGKFPHGLWRVTSVLFGSAWEKRKDPNDDVAIFLIGQDDRKIEKFTGAEKLVIDARLPRLVQVIGYPDKASSPVTCTAKARKLDKKNYSQLVFDCGGFPDGTSGGPFLMHVGKSGTGEIIGVIGGYQQGGDTSSISYSAEFLYNVATLYKQAVAKARG